ncbi:oligopeptide transport system permease protein [Clostridium acidisoli DSM 12555]|uniref:Oligopeptide transport system permease protein n=1 Tax=Clostridium acidisoli DSM 12555 TaxID=1121291 RepID=A0A1W1XAG1_9CLOT|nr:ABC transporter permease [Clostridium acidisoli]SMC20830.1 oligopeptide transport system permease protein [Clostridium acidisoli DSM 12555]
MQFSKDMFEFVPKEEKDANKVIRPSLSYWQDVWGRIRKNKLAMAGLIFIILISLAAIFVPMISKYDYTAQDLSVADLGPSGAHWFGTDKFGRDLFVRVLVGARISLTIGLVASILSIFIGVLYGGISGYFGGVVDNIMMRIVEAIYAIPMTIYVILIMVVLGPGLKSIIIALTISFWITMARIVRGQIMSLKEQEFVLAAKTIGASPLRIILKHLIPNCMGQIIVTLTLSIPDAIFQEAFLSFIGLGIAPPLASWGSLASDSLGGYQLYPYQLLFPSLAISLTMFAFNVLGDGLTYALDPKMRK